MTSFSINIEPTFGTSWAVPVQRIELKGSSLTREVFVSVWKALENELSHLKIKADLVQLCGYYQYAPAFKSSMFFTDGLAPEKEWEIVGLTVEGMAVGKILPYSQVARLWSVSTEQVITYSKWLRNLGYEVRNQNTNPQMPDDALLIPYSFPTLTNMSVQLRKSLENQDA
jgi:DNA (cytosine-5)-methyltransferase 1